MAEEEKNEAGDAEEGKKSGPSIIVLIVVLVVSMGAGFAVPMFLKPGAEVEEPQEDPNEPPALVEFGEVVVNLNEEQLNRYLRVNISLVVAQSRLEEAQKLVDENQAMLKNWAIGYLADKSMQDIRGALGQNRLRREIKNHFNVVMSPEGPPVVRNVLFGEFNVQ